MSDSSTRVTNLSPLKQAYLALEEMQKKLEAVERTRNEPIAIIGMGCRFPGGATNPQAFWQLLRNGVDAIRDVPTDRWDVNLLYDADPNASGKLYTRRAGFLERVDLFDPQFFGVSPREAVSLDPQQRLLLEVTWEALEHAGIAPDQLQGSRTGVFVGIASSDYATLQLKSHDLARLDAYYGSGIAHSVAAGRISYILGLQGPSIALDTACSSSLVATHLAVSSLRAGECRMALAAGVHLILSPENTIAFSKSHMLAPDGTCKTFDARADGFADGEGCGVIVLKKLNDALADGDRVLAIIRGSAINQDGASSGLTAPNGPAQEAVIRESLANGNVKPHEVSYIEAHGTGTSLGDPIEVQALGAVLRAERQQPFYLGSVKTNLGHLEAAAGVAGLIKVVLMMQQREIPPHLHFETPNPLIPWSEIPAIIPTKLEPWNTASRIAGVSAFGFSGTNAHIVLEQAPQKQVSHSGLEGAARPMHLLTLSAKNENALRELKTRFGDYLAANPHEIFSDVAFTTNAGRAHFPHRCAIIAATTSEAREKLAALNQGQLPAGTLSGELTSTDRPKIAFLFTGQGAQYIGMGRLLYDSQPIFRAALDRCVEIGRPMLGAQAEIFNLKSEIDETAYTQPALFAIEYALAELWKSWGIVPNAVMGHSVGEYVAACMAGVFSLEEGLKLIVERGRLMQKLPSGGVMAAVLANESQVANAIGEFADTVSIAALNGPENTVISGARVAVQTVLERLHARGVKSKMLAVSHAFHSPFIEPMLSEFERVLASVTFGAPKIRLISNLTGKPVTSGELSSTAYWLKHTRHAVRFADSMNALRELGCGVFVEIGPQPVLMGMGKRCLEDYGVWVPSLRQNQNDWQTMLTSLGSLYINGAGIDWAGFDKPYARQKLDLPTYPFQRERYWIPTTPPMLGSQAIQIDLSAHPTLGSKISSPLANAQFESRLSAASLAWLNDHRVFGTAILPATGFIEAFFAAAEIVLKSKDILLEELMIHQALVVPDDETRTTQVIAQPDGTLQFFSINANEPEWKLHATAHARVSQATTTTVSLDEIRARCGEPITADVHYANLREHNLDFGASLRGVQTIWRGASEALGEIQLPDAQVAELERYVIHPAWLDASLQILAEATSDNHETFLPVSVATIRLHRPLTTRVWSYGLIYPGENASKETFRADVRVCDASGHMVAEILGLYFKRANRSAVTLNENYANWLYQVAWQAQPRSAADLDQIASQVEPNVAMLYEKNGLAAYAEFLPQIESLSVAYIAQAFGQLGVTWKIGERFTTSALVDRLGVVASQRRLFARLLEILSEEKILRCEGESWQIVCAPEFSAPQQQLAELSARYPFASAEVALLGRCAPPLAQVLRGETDPLQLLFPGGSFDAAEQLYQRAPFALTYNALVNEIVTRATQGRAVRILEIGAGTGGTTSFILPNLSADDAEYMFTDISPLFIAKAQEKFRAYPFVRYQSYDIEQDPLLQGFSANQFDVIVATNVIHATTDLRKSLGHVQQLLARDGVFVMIEVNRPQRWVDLTFGMTDGWWRFVDSDLRPTYPLLSQKRWLDLFDELGFNQPIALPRNSENNVALSLQSIVMARAPRPHARWLVLVDNSGVGAKLAAALESRGEKCLLVQPGAEYGKIGNDRWQINPAQPADFERVVREAFADDCVGVIHLWSLDIPGPSASVQRDQMMASGSPLHLAQALIKSNAAKSPRLYFVTQNAQSVHSATENMAIEQSPVWGLAKTIRLEHPEFDCTTIDVDVPSLEKIDTLAQEILGRNDEDQIALRGDHRYVARLSRYALQKTTDESPVHLEISTRGSFDGLMLNPMMRRQPGLGEVELRVLATGLNFRDVMNVLAMRDDPEPLGSECSGVIVAVGEGVENFAIGDHVMAIASGCFSTYATTRVEWVERKPEHLTFAQAATIPMAFLTAHYMLNYVAKLSAQDRILIHAAAGGVGMAAVQLAKQVGAEIYCTAGSPEKRDWLKSLGVQHVMNSRTLDFADEIRTLTNGQGVDVVLNSLAGEFIPKSLSALSEHGRFLEIGKRDIWDATQVAQLKPNASYHAVDLGTIFVNDLTLTRKMFDEIRDAINHRTLEPLPVQTFDLEKSADAFRYMATAKHMGKIVMAQSVHSPVIHANATYLITGGLGGLGLIFARWLIEQGARHLVLLGRTDAQSDFQRTRLREFQDMGAQVVVARGDAGQRNDVSAVLSQIKQTMPRLRGIIHAAGVLDDGGLLQQDWSRFKNVMTPKIAGAWHLHALTQQQSLDFFVLFSSIASVLGSSGQANHAAANMFLDTLAHYRRALGLPALGINWGAWSDVGAAVEHDVVSRIASQGMGTISPQSGVEIFERLWRQGATQVAVMPIEWSKFALPRTVHRPSAFLSQMVAKLPQVKQGIKPSNIEAEPHRLQIILSAPSGKQRAMLIDFVREQAGRVLQIDATKLPSRVPLSDLGLDSLMAVELRNLLGTGLGLKTKFPATLVFDYPTIETMADYLARELLPASNEKEMPIKSAQVLETIEELSDDQVDRLFEEKFRQDH